jgi:hypothetical protein
VYLQANIRLTSLSSCNGADAAADNPDLWSLVPDAFRYNTSVIASSALIPQYINYHTKL